MHGGLGLRHLHGTLVIFKPSWGSVDTGAHDIWAVAGLVAAPVVAVPSLGSPGAPMQGTTALLGALAAASAGVAVSHIDSGMGAALLAARMLRCADRLRQPRS